MKELSSSDPYKNIMNKHCFTLAFFMGAPIKKVILITSLFLCIHASLVAQFTVTISNVMATTPANPVLRQYLTTNVACTMIYNRLNPTDSAVISAYLFGRIESVSSDLTITTRLSSELIVLSTGKSVIVTNGEILNAFGGLSPNNISIDGQSASGIDPNNIVLPDGNYRICFFAGNENDCNPNAPQCFLSDFNGACNTLTVNCNPPNSVSITTIAKLPVNPVISQAISTGGIISTIQGRIPVGCNVPARVKLFGKIQRISPSPFSISVNPEYQQQAPLTLNAQSSVQLTPGQEADAFGNFNESVLVTEGIELASIKDAANNIKLPDGNYRICFYARYINSDGILQGNASDPNLGCATFNICYQAGGAPQFTQPVSNLDINSDMGVVQPASPVVFTWTPPQSTCGLPAGGYTYDFEIRELFANQTVNDAINNPYVFRKTLLPSTTFLLDTNLNKNVLVEGKRYAIRVRAVSISPNSPVEIDNNGYSRIEAFQYGGRLITQNDNPRETEDYYIPFKERQSGFWSDVYAAYKNRARGDTLVPIEEYIAFALTQNGTAYSLDAIELFLDLNPELAEAKKVKISYTPNLPVFPVVPANDQSNFDKEHQVNLEPDKFKGNKFLKYLDTLNNYKQKIPDNAVKMINDLVSHLNNIKTDIDSVDRVTVDLINKALSELLYELHLYSKGMNKSQYNQLQGLVSALLELTALSPDGTAFLYLYPSKKRSSLSSYQSNISDRKRILSLINNAQKINDDSPARLLSAIIKQLLPFDVIVYRDSKGAPSTPVLDAPDLKRTYRIFYALPNLYNHKFPEINSNSISRLASTVQVSLPSNTVFTFWATNMVNHKVTKAKDVDLRGVLSEANKLLPNLKKPSIVIKVD